MAGSPTRRRARSTSRPRRPLPLAAGASRALLSAAWTRRLMRARDPYAPLVNRATGEVFFRLDPRLLACFETAPDRILAAARQVLDQRRERHEIEDFEV